MRNNIYIENAKDIARSIRETLKEDYIESLHWANETVKGIITHRAHYEMERCTYPVKFNHQLWNEIPKESINNDPEWNFAFARHSILLNLAKSYAYTLNIEYKNAFTFLFESFFEYSDINGLSWRSLEAGIRPENWIRAIEIFKEVDSPLSDTLIGKINMSLEVHKELLLNTHRNFHRLSNWGIIQEHGLFVIALYLDDISTIDIALKRLEEEARLQIFDDGTHWEQSPLYHTEILHSLLDTIMLSRRHCIPIPKLLEDKARNAAEQLYASIAFDNHIFMQGDSDWIEAEDLVYTAKRLFPDLNIEANKREENYWDFGDKIEPKIELKRKESIYLENSKNAYLRGNEVEAHMYFGNIGSGHGHISPLHIDVYAHKLAFLIDSGRYTYVDSKERYELKSLKAHNTVIIDDTAPDIPIESWSYSSIPLSIGGSFKHTDNFDYIEATNLSYLDLKTAIRRKMLRLGDDIIVIIDEIISNTSHSASVLWHIAPEGNAKINKSSIEIERERQKLYIWTNARTIELKDCYISKHYNKVEPTKVLKLSDKSNRTFNIATVISSKPITVQEIPIMLLDSNRVLTRDEGIALEITTQNDKWTILTRAKEIVSQVDILKAGEIEGYGMTLIKHNSWKWSDRIM